MKTRTYFARDRSAANRSRGNGVLGRHFTRTALVPKAQGVRQSIQRYQALRSEVEALDAREVLLVRLHRPTTSTVLHVPVADAKNSSPSANKPAISTDYPHRNWRH
jgi:hypothetical protein